MELYKFPVFGLTRENRSRNLLSYSWKLFQVKHTILPACMHVESMSLDLLDSCKMNAPLSLVYAVTLEDV